MKIQALQLVKRAPKDGVSVARIDNYYLCEATGTVPSVDDSRWTLVNEGEKIPVPTAAAPYLWHKSVTVMSDGTTLAPVIEFCGSLGKNGFDYDLVPSASTIIKKEDGTLSPSRVTCSLIRREADGTATGLTVIPSGYSVKYLRDGADIRDYELGIPIFVDTASSITFSLYYGNILIERHDIQVISEGAQGVAGRGIQSQDYRFRALAENKAPAAPTSDTEWNLWYALANADYSAEKPYLFRCIKTVYVDGAGITTTEYTVDGPTVWGNDAVTYEIQPENGSMIDGESCSLYFYIYKIAGSERTPLSLADIKANGMQCIETGGTMLYRSQLKKFVFAISKAVFGQEYTFGLKASNGEVLCSYTWTVQKQGDKGDKGDKGDNALYIDCAPDSFTYPADADGSCTQAATNTVTLRLMYGVTQVTNYSVEVRTTDDEEWYTEDTYANQGGDVYVRSISRSGNDVVISINVGESSYVDNNAWVQVRMTTTIDGKEVSAVKQINCYANKEGKQGYDGVTIRRSEWEAGKEYRNDTEHMEADADGNYYLDEVCVSDYNDGEGKYFICKQTHTSSASNKPPQNGTSTYWTAMNNLAPIKTPFADITRAVIVYLQSKQITIEQDGTAYGAFGGGDYPLWFGGSSASKAVFRVDKSGRLQANTVGYDISLPDPIDDKPTCIGVPCYLWTKDTENEQLGAAQMFTLETSVIRISPKTNYFYNKGDGSAPENLFFCIPQASEVGKHNLEIYVNNPTIFKTVSNAPDVFICQGEVTGNPTKIENGVYISSSYNCSIEIYSSSDGTSPTYRIYDPMNMETYIKSQYFPNVANDAYKTIGMEYGYIELKKYQGVLPRYLRLLSNGKNWYLMEYRY